MNTSPINYSRSRNLKETIEYFYEQESEEWHETVHKRGGSCKENIYNMLDTISEGAIVYEVLVGEERAGFFTYYEAENGDAFMEAFHVLRRYRRPWFFEAYWKMIKEIYDQPILIGIPEQNKEAILHLQRQGFEYQRIVSDDKRNYFLLKLNI